jgi:hypothetical protein
MVEQQSEASVVEVLTLAIAQEYCIGMRGVNIADQLQSSYCI